MGQLHCTLYPIRDNKIIRCSLDPDIITDNTYDIIEDYLEDVVNETCYIMPGIIALIIAPDMLPGEIMLAYENVGSSPSYRVLSYDDNNGDCWYCCGEGWMLCACCNGSGEGMRDGSRCHTCKGKGEIICTECTYEYDDYDEHDDYDK